MFWVSLFDVWGFRYAELSVYTIYVFEVDLKCQDRNFQLERVHLNRVLFTGHMLKAARL